MVAAPGHPCPPTPAQVEPTNWKRFADPAPRVDSRYSMQSASRNHHGGGTGQRRAGPACAAATSPTQQHTQASPGRTRPRTRRALRPPIRSWLARPRDVPHGQPVPPRGRTGTGTSDNATPCRAATAADAAAARARLQGGSQRHRSSQPMRCSSHASHSPSCRAAATSRLVATCSAAGDVGAAGSGSGAAMPSRLRRRSRQAATCRLAVTVKPHDHLTA